MYRKAQKGLRKGELELAWLKVLGRATLGLRFAQLESLITEPWFSPGLEAGWQWARGGGGVEGESCLLEKNVL